MVVCTGLSGKDSHRQVGVDGVIASGSLSNVTISALAPEWQDVYVSNLLVTLAP